MTDFATLVLGIDSTQVKTGTASLDGLTAAGIKAEAATAALGTTAKSASVGAATMAREAQAAAHGLGSFGMSANNARIVGLELTHVTRSMTEQIAMGVSPVRALTMELGRLSTAAQYAGGVGGLGRAVFAMLAPFAAVAAGAGILATALLGVKQAAADDVDMQKFIGTLGLTKKEIEKLKDTTVTWGDVTKATFQVLAENAGTSSKAISGFFSSAFRSIGEFGKFSVAVILAAFGGMVQGAHDLILNLPAIVGNGITAAANLGIIALEKMVNYGIVGLNKLGSVINNVLGTHLGQVAEISLGRVSSDLGGALKDIGADVSATFHRIFNQTEATFDSISARAAKLARDRVLAQAEDLIGDRADKAAKKAKKAKEEVDHLAEALKQLDHLLYLFANAKVEIDQGSVFQDAGPDLDKMFGKLPDYGNQLVASLQAIAAQAQVTGQILADAFGKPGDVLGGLLANLANYAVLSQQVSDQVAQGTITQAAADKHLAAARIQATGQLIGGLKTLFKEHSAGYKAMEAAERAFAIIQAISTIKSVAAGAAKMFSQLGVWAFPAVGAMIAVMAGLGFAGGSSTQKAPGIPESGTGTVLGDPAAKSESITASLDLMAKNSTRALDYSSDMVRALRNIESGIGNLTAAIARSLNVGGGFFDTTGKLGTSSKGIQGLFGSTTTKSLYDQGFQFNPASVGQIMETGISGATYQVIEKIKKKSGFLGIGGGTKTSYTTTTGALDSDITSQIDAIIGNVYKSVVDAAKILGLDVGDALKQFQVSIGKISFKDLTGQQITDQLNAVFSKIGDQMAGFAVAGFADYQKAGEGMFETLMRLAKDYLTVDAALKPLGMTFGSVGASSIAAREKLIDLAGGLDAFVSQVNYFTDHFLTDAQKAAFAQTQVDAAFKALGVSVPASIADFAGLVEGLNLSTDAGQAMFAALMQIAPAFYDAATAADALAKQQQQAAAQAAQAAADLQDKKNALQVQILQAKGKDAQAIALQRQLDLAKADPALRDLMNQLYAAQDAAAKAAKAAEALAAREQATATARDNLAQAYHREADALQQTIDKFSGFAATLRTFRDSLFAGGSGPQSYNGALVQLMKQAGLAVGGDEGALGGGLQDSAQSFIDVATANAHSLQDVQRAKALVARYLDQAIGSADSHASVAQQQLTALHDQVDKLVDIDDHVLSVADAIRALNPTQGATPRTPRTPPPPRQPRVDRDKALHDRLDNLHRAMEAVAINTGKVARVLRDADRGGALAFTADSDSPIPTVAG